MSDEQTYCGAEMGEVREGECECPRCKPVEEPLAFPNLQSPTGWCKPITMEFSFHEVDPEVLGILTGGVMGSLPESEFAIEMVSYVPVKRRVWRVVWEWLRRTPRKHRQVHYYIPHAVLASGNEEER